MAIFFKSIAVAIVGAALGLFLTWLSIEQGRGFGAVRAGPWIGWPKAGTLEADPYARAAMSRTGEVPLDPAEGLTFIARVDSQGVDLNPACTYVIRPPIPVSRFWTVSIVAPDGLGGISGLPRQGITSRELYRSGANDFTLTLSPQASSGNWLPLKANSPFVLLLRLYDTPVSAAAAALAASELPSIERGACP